MKKQIIIEQPFKVLASGEGWLAVDKPAGMSVHNDPGKDLCTRLSQRLQTEAALRATTGLGANSRLNAAHRLDRETSGVILLAGDRAVLNHFAAQFEARTVHKQYAALLHGHLPESGGPDPWRSWTWSLTKTPGGRKDPQGKGPRKACTTLVRVLDYSAHYTLAECRLLTGRKHQIRRHAKLAGHPVVGDHRYGPKRALAFLRDKQHFTRLGLHASRLEIQLPDGSPGVIHSLALPGEMQSLFAEDGQTAGLNTPAQPSGLS